MDDVVPVKRALLSVSDKTGLVEFARFLAGRGVALLASGGTFRALEDAGIRAKEVSAFTRQPEILGGRVKTLHPAIFAGILARRDRMDDMSTLHAAGFETIDLVVVNLYPFERTVAVPGVALEDAVEQIDIGGPSLIRAAAKNHAHVAIVTRPSQYAGLSEKLRMFGGTSLATRRRLALSAFRHTAHYDRAISNHLESAGFDPEDSVAMDGRFPARLGLEFDRRAVLRYGENPHQAAAFYTEPELSGSNLGTAKVRHGKELSYNNLLDLDAALRLVRSFRKPGACILKHNNPCGAAVASDLAEAFELAYEGDPVSAFGGIVGCNRPVNEATAERMARPGRFIECILAPGYEPKAFEILTTRPSWKNSVRLLELGGLFLSDSVVSAGFDLRRVEGGLLVQTWDTVETDPASWRSAARRAPTDEERASLEFAWIVCASVKSNAIVLVRGQQVVGVGAGQMSRVDSVRLAIEKAGDRARGSVMASDAFFPFRDGPDLAAAAGIMAIVQPGGSKRDDETYAACDEHGMAMLLTGQRHFRH